LDEVLITGATGFIGRHLQQRLAGSFRIVAAGRHDPGVEGVRWVRVDLAAPDLVGQLPKRADAVVHLAAITPGAPSLESGFDVNARSTELLRQWAEEHGARTFVLASTGSVYGGGLTRPYREDDPLVPKSESDPYTSTKIAAEEASASSKDLVTIVVRPFFPYGKGQSTVRLLPRLHRSVTRGEPVTIHGEDGAVINPVHITDAVEALAAALRLGASTTVNIAGPEVLTIGEIVRKLSARVGRDAVVDRRPDVAPRHLVGDISLMRKLLYSPQRCLSEELDGDLSVLF